MTRVFRRGPRRYPLRALAIVLLTIAFAAGIFAVAAWFLGNTREVELVGPLLPRLLMSMVLLILVAVLLVSTTISSFSVFFLSDDLNLLMAAPVPLGPLFYARYIEMAVVSAWMVLFFGMPVIVAFGVVYGAGADFYLWMAILFPTLLTIPVALGAIIAVLLTRLFSARRSRDLLVVLVVVGFIGVYLLIRTLRPERLLEQDSFGTMLQFLDMMRSPESPWLPSQWLTTALFELLEGRPLPGGAVLLLLTTSTALTALAGWVGTGFLRDAYNRTQTGRVRTEAPLGTQGPMPLRARLLGPWLDRFGHRLDPLTGSLLVKDLRVFLRDTTQWLQLLLLGALAVVYILNFTYLKLAEFSWFVLYTVNHAMVGLVLSGVAVRFVFPAISLEGRAWWIVRAAPVELGALMHSKLLIHFAPIALLGVGLSVLSCIVIEAPLFFGIVSVGLVLLAALGIAAIGVGLGGVFPRFDAENVAKIPAGLGGVMFMITSMSFVMAYLFLSVYPTFVLVRWPTRPDDPIGRPFWFAASLAALAVLAITACTVPMWLGRRALSRREE